MKYINSNNFITMRDRSNKLHTTYGNQYTDTYMSSLTNKTQHELIDRNVFKAIKQNKVELLVDKQREGHTQSLNLYDQDKELSAIVISTRKKYDQEKIQTTEKEKSIHKLQEERHLLELQRVKMQKQKQQIVNFHQTAAQKQKEVEKIVQNADYMKAVRLHMKDVLKADILHFKKQCFDQNVRLIRTNTHLKDILSKATNKKHMKSKCQLVLNSLHQTVQMREAERSIHLDEVESLVRKKVENSELKSTRIQQLQLSMNKAMTERLPQEKLAINKFQCELFLRKVLRSKMLRLIQYYKQVETSFNIIKKQTRIATVAEFIDDYLHKERRYNELLQSISIAEAKINAQKVKKSQLLAQEQRLNTQIYEIEQLMESHKHHQQQNLMKQLNIYNQQVVKINKLQLEMKRWSVKNLIRFKNSNEIKGGHHQYSEYADQFKGLSAKQMFKKTLKVMMESIDASDKTQQVSPQKASEMTTERSQSKIHLRDLSESVLSKQYSRRNFRVKTVAGTHEVVEQQNNQYEDMSEYDFLKINRRLVKKNNKTAMRARIKTKAY